MDAKAAANPYIAGSPVTGPEMFFGREDVFAFVRRALVGRHRDNVVVLYGQQRTGKTSALYQLGRHLGPRYACVFVDLHGLALEDLAGFLWELAGHIARALRRDYQVALPRPDRAAFQDDPRGEFEGAFLPRVWAALGERHLVLLLDEATRLQERVRAGRLEPGTFTYLRHLMQHHERLVFLFALGSGLEELERDYAYLFNVALYKRISFLDRAAAVALITEPAAGCYAVTPPAVARILAVTSGHPYYTQLLCHGLFQRWQQHGRARVTAADVEAILAEAVERGSAVLKHVWEEATPGEQATLAGLAAVGGGGNRPVGALAIARVWAREGAILPAGELARALRSLVAREVLVGQGRYRFAVELQRLWIERHRRLAWVRDDLAPVLLTGPPGAAARPASSRWLGGRALRYGAAGAILVALLGVGGDAGHARPDTAATATAGARATGAAQRAAQATGTAGALAAATAGTPAASWNGSFSVGAGTGPGAAATGPATAGRVTTPTVSTAAITIRPTAGPAGTKFVISGSDFTPGETIHYTVVAPDGSAFANNVVPLAMARTKFELTLASDNAAPGVYTVVFSRADGTQATAKFTVTADVPVAATPTAPPPTVTPPPPQASDWGPALAPLKGGKGYKDPDGRFSFRVPQDWSQIQQSGTDVAFSAPRSGRTTPATMNVVLSQTSDSLDQVDQRTQQQIQQQYKDFKLVSRDKVTVNGIPAYRRVFTVTVDGVPVEIEQVYLVDHQVAHILTFAATPDSFGDSQPTFDAVAGSYQVGN
ncbi:MAG TPA: AAA family ATPase [Thermomicrobiales bacterium]|nr:AAA family ATPase [Thermomicrobiales bacterium]